MPSLLYTFAIETFVPVLGSLSGILDKAVEHAAAQNLDPTLLPNARLAPDMFPLTKQVQIACDTAKNSAGRLAGETPPRFEDTEQSLQDLNTRIARALDYIKTISPTAFDGAEARDITFPLQDSLVFEAKGLPYLKDWVLPNFYFHVVTAYDILRHHGVQIGKRDFLAHAGPHIRSGDRKVA